MELQEHGVCSSGLVPGRDKLFVLALKVKLNEKCLSAGEVGATKPFLSLKPDVVESTVVTFTFSHSILYYRVVKLKRSYKKSI